MSNCDSSNNLDTFMVSTYAESLSTSAEDHLNIKPPRAIASLEADSIVNPPVTELSRPLMQPQATLEPIPHLPPEILLCIFRFIAGGIYRCHRDSFKLTMSLLAVSRTWRHLALGCFELWSTLYAGLSIRLFEMFLDRSGNVPLEFHYSFIPCRRFAQHISALSPHRNRLVVCCLHRIWSRRAIYSLLEEAFPALEVLSLSSTLRALCRDYSWHAEQPIPAGAQLCLTNAPRLRELFLKGVYFPLWPHTPIYLTKLTLSHLSYYLPGEFSLLFRALEAAPLLEELHLRYIDTSNLRTRPRPADAPIQLPRLHTMAVENPAPRDIAQYILSSIIAPPLSSFTFVGKSLPLLDLILPQWSSFHTNFPGLTCIRDLDVAVTCEDFIETAHVTVTVTGLPAQSEVPVFRISFIQHRDDISNDTFPLVMEGLHRALPELPFLATLSLSNYSPPSASSPARQSDTVQLFAEFLARHTQIEELALTGFCNPWTEVLATTLHGHLCPRMRKLTLVRCPIVSELLMDIVSSRAKSNSGQLDELLLRDCLHIHEATVARLGLLVAHVESQ
ncbi:hypothetical protein BOTBODRAFT_29708 [Botryobasidium botryosum FD-172 SS1]|uniref:Uncharacterized protein n=1 Tax=Botryobasidium botryosum (strain FD-172 SS1) TaxID=930990 RepID=A0A067MP38_BOTB1|nr:hypothetical protein BOTBODRAFT_29708 [Botryobasidium botryosum FD-172 SS1]